MPKINVGVGISQEDNLIEAVKEAAKKARQELNTQQKEQMFLGKPGEVKEPDLLMFFSIHNPDWQKENYQKAQETIYEIFKNKEIPLVGGTAVGFFAKDKYYFDISILGEFTARLLGITGKLIKSLKFKGIGVLALQSNWLSIGAGIGFEAFENPEKAGKDCIDMAFKNLQYNPSLAYMAMLKRGVKDITRFRPLNAFLITPGFKDGCLYDQKILDGITAFTKRTLKLIGGGVFGGMGKTGIPQSGYHFFNGKVYEEAVVSIVFGSELEIGYGTATGAKLLCSLGVITKAKDYILYEINNRPAVTVAEEALEKYLKFDKEEFKKHPMGIIGMGYTLAFQEMKGDYWWPISFVETIDKKYFKMMLPVKEGLGINLVQVSPERAQKATAIATKVMKEDADAKDFGLILFSSCGARAQILGLKYSKEIESIKKALGKKDIPCFGICSCGEQTFYKTGPMTGTQFTIAMMGISNASIFISKEAR